MRLVKINCNSCNAQLEIDIENMQAHCPYCGQNLLLDPEQMGHFFVEKEQTKRAQEKTKRAEEATKRTQIKYEYKNKKARRDITTSLYKIIGFAVLLIFLLGCPFYMSHREEQIHQANGEIKVSVSSEDLKQETADDAAKILRNIGFQNVEKNNMKDLKIGLFSKEGDIESITINGNSNFLKEDWFSANAIVIITYHGFSED